MTEEETNRRMLEEMHASRTRLSGGESESVYRQRGGLLHLPENWDQEEQPTGWDQAQVWTELQATIYKTIAEYVLRNYASQRRGMEIPDPDDIPVPDFEYFKETPEVEISEVSVSGEYHFQTDFHEYEEIDCGI